MSPQFGGTRGIVEGINTMNTRTSTRSVTFRHPFMLKAFEAAQPAGTYKVTTEEEVLDSVSAPAYRRISTEIELVSRARSAAIIELVSIDPHELEAALARDADSAAPDRDALPPAVTRAPGGT